MTVYPKKDPQGAPVLSREGLPRFSVKVWDPHTKSQIQRRAVGESAALALDAELTALVATPLAARTPDPVKTTIRANWTPAAPTAMTVRQWAEIYIERFRTRPDGTQRGVKSIKAEADSLSIYLLPEFGDHPLDGVRGWEVQDWLTTLTRKDGVTPLSGHTKESIAGATKRLFKVAVQRGVLPDSPVRDLPSAWGGGKDSDRAMIVPSFSDVELLAAAMEREIEGFGAVIELIAYSGMRWEEAAALVVDDVDWSDATIFVHCTTPSGTTDFSEYTKTAAARRRIPISSDVREPLRRLIALGEKRRAGNPNFAGPRFVLTNKYGGSLHYSTWKSSLEKARRDSGVDLTAHELRHFAASVFIAVIPDEHEIARIMGHRTAAYTRKVYGHLFPTDGNPLADRLSEGLALLRENERRLGRTASLRTAT